MGNVQSGSTLTRTSAALDSFVAELGADIVYDKSLGSARFLKTVKCRHRNGYLVVKIFIKPDPGLSLRSYVRRLKVEKEALQDITNAYNYQSFVETEKAGYLVRQWIASNLYDRISTRPFLSPIEKKWITFQLLNALRDARNRKVSHGDIKSENILVTSWNWVYLTDFASYKPTYLPLDDPADFSFFFDTSGRRTCYIAPERFFTAADNPEISAKKSRLAMEDMEGKRDGKVNEAMDCFSVGCVIAELFLEGAPLFTLSQLFKYREGDYVVSGPLSAIEDEGVRNLIHQMIDLEPSNRPTFDTILHTSRGSIFPESFYSFLHNYVSSVNELPSTTTSPFSDPLPTGTVFPASAPATVNTGRPILPSSLEGAVPDLLPSDSDRRIERIWADYESVEPYLVPEALDETVMDVKVDYPSENTNIVSKPFQDILPVELHIPNRDSKLRGAWNAGPRAAAEDGPALIILALVTANIRNCSLPSAKIRALDVFLALATHLTDEAKLDRMVPYIVDLLHDEAAIVRASALRSLIQVLMLVTVITPSNAAIFPEYIIPNIRHLIVDPEVSVRCMYAQCIVQLADTARRYLELGQALKAHGTFKLSQEGQDYDLNRLEASYDTILAELQSHLCEHLSALLVDSSPIVKRALLHNISSLCIFLGRQKTNDVVLSHMITYLNDREWLLRYAFFESVVDVAACAGGRSLEEYILPLMVQALSDVEETVVAKVLAALTSLCELGLFQKMRIWELLSATLGFLYHPNIWIRQGAAAFISAAVNHLSASDAWCILYPSLRFHLKSEIATIDDASLLLSIKPSISRPVFDGAVQWARKTDKTNFWKGQKRSGASASTRVESARESMVSLRKAGSVMKSKSEEDDANLAKLQQLGMTGADETKLQAMRDYIVKLANNISSFASRQSIDVDSERALKTISDIELAQLGVVPQTVFLKSRPEAGRSARLSLHTSNLSASRSLMSPQRMSRASSDQGAPFEDLRRRLATINGSTSSVNANHTPRDAQAGVRGATSPLAAVHPVLPGISTSTSSSDRPPSPTESVVSTATSSVQQPQNRLHIGSMDGQKAAPAVGSSKANAVGVLDAHSKMVSEDNEEVSGGRTSPSLLNQTVKANFRKQIPSALPISTYDGQEAGISNVLENLYLDSERDYQHDFGPKVHEGPLRRRNAPRQSFHAHARDSSRRTEASLVAHLSSHSEAINAFAVSPDHLFFVSASDDKTVKVWDTARLERNVTSKPRQTYGQHHARVKAICMLEGTHCFASAADDGSLHVVRVYVVQSGSLPKYNRLQLVREHRMDIVGEYVTAMVHYNSDTASNLIFSTTHSLIKVLDLRTMRVLQTMENPRHYGPITCLCLDRKKSWILAGTSTGVLTLWDRRFGLQLKSWHVGIASTGRSVRIHQCVNHPTKGKGKWVMVAVETTPGTGSGGSSILIEVWDVEKSALVETFVSRRFSTEAMPDPHDVMGVDADTSPSAAIAALVRSRQSGEDGKRRRTSSQEGNLPRLDPAPDVRAMIVGSDFGGHSSHRHERREMDGSSSTRNATRPFVVTGSEDRKLRFWDIARVERSAVLSGLDTELDKPTYSLTSSSSSNVYVETSPAVSGASQSNRPPQRMSLITHNQPNLVKSHQDIITALACIDSPFRGGVVTGDRAGAIKVWRVDLGDQ